jgi:hypothetical protein
VIDPGVTGYIVESIDQAMRALGPLLNLDRKRIRRHFEERFTAGRMAADYVRLYESQLALRGRRRKAIMPARPILLPARRPEQPIGVGSAAD